jgi:autotransporter family porin
LNIAHTLSRRYLAAVAAALCVPVASAETLPPPLVADHTELDIAAGTYETTEESRPGLLATNGGKAEGTDVIIRTEGRSAFAVYAMGPSSQVTLTGGMLQTKGVQAHGLYVRNTQGPATSLYGVDIRTEGGSANGAMFKENGANGRFEGGSIVTSGNAALGILGEDGGQFFVQKTTVSTSGDNAGGLVARGNSSSLSARSASIDTSGRESHGVYTQDTATATLEDTRIKTTGEWANALNINANSGLVTVTRSNLRTEGANSSGVTSSDGAPVSLLDTHIETFGAKAVGVDDRGASVTLGNVDISTHGRRGHGVLAQGGDHPGRLPQVDVSASRIVTSGDLAVGAFATKGGSTHLRDTSVTTSGASADGLLAAGGDIRSTNSTIHVTGDGSYGAIVQGGGSLRMTGGSIHSEKGAALGLEDPGTVRIGGGAVLTGGSGSFAEVDPGSTQAFTVVLDDKASAIGDITLSKNPNPPPTDETKFSLAIRNNATWTGASTIVRGVSLESGGTWTLTADSSVSHLRNDHGIVDFAPAVAGSFATLTIAGDYEGNEGLFRMRGRLGDDSSPADLVHVTGSTSGNSLIAVDSLDGAGAHTNDGIPLVRVDGTSEGTFLLSGRAVAGAHEYFLHKGSLSQPDDGDWYLRSTLPEPPTIDPEKTTDPDEPEIPETPEIPRITVLRPETGTYRANQTAALEMFQGGPGAGEDDERDDARHAVWARFERRHTTFDLRDQIATTTSANELTLGADLFRGGEAIESHVGVMAAAGQADTRGTSLLTRYSAKGRVRGAAAGIYGGFRSEAGTYLRGWTQYAHFSQRVEGDALQMERYSSSALTTSVEAGHRWRTALSKHTDAYLEPQAQILTTRLRGGAHTEANGTRIAPLHGTGSTTRLGMRAAARWQTPNGHVASPYVAVSWLRRLGRLDATQFDGEAFAGGVPRNSYALKLGVTLLRRTGWSLWGDVETRFGARNYRRFAGTLGVRKTW